MTILEEKDLPFVMELRNKVRANFDDSTETTPEKHRAWFERTKTTPNVTYYVVWDGEKRIGLIGVRRTSEGNELTTGMLLPEYQGKGIMSKVYMKLMEGSNERWWGYAKSFNIGAIKAMQKAGFRIYHTTDTHTYLHNHK